MIFDKQFFRRASGGGNISALQEARYDDDAICASCENCREIVQLDSTNAKNRKLDQLMNAPNVVGPDRLIFGLGRRGKERAKADVVGAFRHRGNRLGQGMGRFPDPAIAFHDLARGGDRKIVLAEMQAFERNIAGDFRMIVDNQGDARGAR